MALLSGCGGGGGDHSDAGDSSVHVSFDETPPHEDDTFKYSSDADVAWSAREPDDDGADLTMQNDYFAATQKAIQNEISRQQKIQGGTDTGQSAEERNNAIAKWVEAMYRGSGRDTAQQNMVQGATGGGGTGRQRRRHRKWV